MERVTRISKMTVDNFEQLMMTVEGLSYENNSKELIDMLKILQAQVNMRVQELEKLNVVEVEENYSDDFINTLAKEMLKTGIINFLTKPSEKLRGLIQTRVEELRSQQNEQPAEIIESADVTELKSEENSEKPKYTDEYIDELAYEMLETGRLSILMPPDAHLLSLVNKRLQEIKAHLDEVKNELSLKVPEKINAKVIDDLARQLIKVGSLKFLNNPPKTLVDAINARAVEIQKMNDELEAEKEVSEATKVEDSSEDELGGYTPEEIDSLARKAIAEGRLTFVSRPPQKLMEAVRARVAEIRSEQKEAEVVEQPTDLSKVEQSENFDSEYVEELAQQVLATGGIRFLSEPPKGLMKAVNARVMEIRSAQLNSENEISEVVEEEPPKYDPAYIDFLAQEVIRTGKLNFTDIPPEGLMTAINNRVIELRELESQKDSVIKL